MDYMMDALLPIKCLKHYYTYVCPSVIKVNAIAKANAGKLTCGCYREVDTSNEKLT